MEAVFRTEVLRLVKVALVPTRLVVVALVATKFVVCVDDATIVVLIKF